MFDSKKTILDKLYFKDKKSFNKKLEIFNITRAEIQSAIEKEKSRIDSLKKKLNEKKDDSWATHTYYIGGKPYYSPKPSLPRHKEKLNSKTIQKNIIKESNSNPKLKVQKKEANNIIILIDGDNHFDEGQKGIEKTPKSISVKAVFSDIGAQRKFDKKYCKRSNVNSEHVKREKKGDQAVDNRIKEYVEKLTRKKRVCIYIVSQDNGYKKLENKYPNQVKVYSSVKDILKYEQSKEKL